MVGLCPAAFQASAGGTAATDTHREELREQSRGTSRGKAHRQKGPFSGGCPQKELCELDCRTEEYAPFLFKQPFPSHAENYRRPKGATVHAQAGCQLPWAEFLHSLSPLFAFSQCLSFNALSSLSG